VGRGAIRISEGGGRRFILLFLGLLVRERVSCQRGQKTRYCDRGFAHRGGLASSVPDSLWNESKNRRRGNVTQNAPEMREKMKSPVRISIRFAGPVNTERIPDDGPSRGEEQGCQRGRRGRQQSFQGGRWTKGGRVARIIPPFEKGRDPK